MLRRPRKVSLFVTFCGHALVGVLSWHISTNVVSKSLSAKKNRGLADIDVKSIDHLRVLVYSYYHVIEQLVLIIVDGIILDISKIALNCQRVCSNKMCF